MIKIRPMNRILMLLLSLMLSGTIYGQTYTSSNRTAVVEPETPKVILPYDMTSVAEKMDLDFKPSRSVIVDNNMYMVDTEQHVIRKIDLATNEISVFAGTEGEAGFATGEVGVGKLDTPSGIVYTPDFSGVFCTSAFLVANKGSNSIMVIEPSGNIAVSIGEAGEAGYLDDFLFDAKFNAPEDIALSPDEKYLYVSDTGNGYIRRVNFTTHEVETLQLGSELILWEAGNDNVTQTIEPMGIDCKSTLIDGDEVNYITFADKKNNTVWALSQDVGFLNTLTDGFEQGHIDSDTDDTYPQFNAPTDVEILSMTENQLTTAIRDNGNNAFRIYVSDYNEKSTVHTLSANNYTFSGQEYITGIDGNNFIISDPEDQILYEGSLTTEYRLTNDGWSHIPPSGADVIIATTTVIADDLVLGNVTIEEGKTLKISKGNTIEIQGNLINNGTGVKGKGKVSFSNTGTVHQITQPTDFWGVLEVQSGATVDFRDEYLIFKEGSILMIDDLSAISNKPIIAEREGKEPTLAYNYWSMPVVDDGQAKVLGSGNRFIYNEAETEWNELTENLKAGQGFTITGAGVVTVKGLPHTGEVDINVTNQGGLFDTGDGIFNYQGYNLIGNPYLAPLSLKDFLENNSTTLDGTVYFYEGQDDGSGTYITKNYVNSNNSESIPSFQGFFVKALTDGTVSFTHSLRGEALQNANFYRTQGLEMQRAWIKLEDEAGLSEEVILAFADEFTDSFDNGYDAMKLEGTLPISLSIVNEFYIQSILSLPNIDKVKAIPLLAKIKQSGRYSITADYSEILASYNLHLKDHKTGILHSFETSETYSFDYHTEDGTDRFSLIAQPLSVPLALEENTTIIKLSATGSGITMIFNNNTLNQSATIQVYALDGKNIFSSSINVFDNNIHVPLQLKSERVYLIKLSIKGSSIVKKVLIP